MKKLTRKTVTFLIALTVVAFTLVPSLNAATVTFGDDSIFWPGWSNSSGDDSQDTIGIPTFTGGTASIEDSTGSLTGLTFNQSTTSSSYWWVISPGDLFIDIDNDAIWDYFVDLTDWTVAGKSNPDPASGSYSIYAIDLAVYDTSTNGDYIFSGTDDSGGWSGYLIRDRHPVAYDSAYGSTGAAGTVDFSGWSNTTPAMTYSFDFSGLTGGGLDLGSEFTIGWTMNCANDVIYETMTNPVPEPATMLLLGSGLIGLAGLGRRKFIKR